jgi:hypothetical protein
MVGLIARLVLLVAASVTSWFVAKDAVNFGAVQMTVAVLLFAIFVFVLAFWPASWTARLGGRPRS